MMSLYMQFPDIKVASGDITACAQHCKETPFCNSAYLYSTSDGRPADPTRCITANVVWILDSNGNEMLQPAEDPSKKSFLAYMDGKCEDPNNSVLPISQCYTDFTTNTWSTRASPRVGNTRLRRQMLHTA